MMATIFRAAVLALCASLIPTAALIVWTGLEGGHFLSPVRIGLYGVLPAVVACGAALLLFVGHRRRVIALINGAAVLAALVAADIWCQWRSYADAEDRRLDDHPAVDYRILAARLRAEGIDAFPQPCGWHLRVAGGAAGSPVVIDGTPVLPLGGLGNNHVFRPVGSGFTDAVADAQGFNNPPGQWVPDGVALMAVGDSFTMGADAPFGFAYADYLRRTLGRVVNLGCNGNGPLFDLAGIVEYGPYMRPPVVLWAYYEGNDLPKDLGVELTSPILPHYLEPGFNQDLTGRREAIDRELRAFLDRYLADVAYMVDRPDKPEPFRIDWRTAVELTSLRLALGLTNGFRPEALDTFAQALQQAQAVVDGWGGRLVFVYLPGQDRFTGPLARVDADGYRQAVLTRVAGLGIDIIDLVPIFEARSDPETLFAGHYSVEGNRVVAEAILAGLAR